MLQVNLLCSNKRLASLAEFSVDLFQKLSIVRFERRESSNYADGTYFRGKFDLGEVTVSLADEEGDEDLLYWVCIELAKDAGALSREIIDELVVDKLLTHGYSVARIEDFGKMNQRRIDY